MKKHLVYGDRVRVYGVAYNYRGGVSIEDGTVQSSETVDGWVSVSLDGNKNSQLTYVHIKQCRKLKGKVGSIPTR